MDTNHIKQVIIICMVILCSHYKANAQAQLVFEYDNAGNQITREWLCINCGKDQSAKTSAYQIKQYDKAINDLKLNEGASTEKRFTAFPNPISETLNVEWKTAEGISMKSIEVFTLTGVRVYEGKCAPGQTSATISFINMIPGAYLLRALYSDGKKETQKLIKQ